MDLVAREFTPLQAGVRLLGNIDRMLESAIA
jgi:hypothetical protein